MALIRGENVHSGEPLRVGGDATLLRVVELTTEEESELRAAPEAPALPAELLDELARRQATVTQAAQRVEQARAAFEEERVAFLAEAGAEAERTRTQSSAEGRAEGERDAEVIREQARADAAVFLDQATRDGEEIRERARAEGYATGMQQARDETDETLRWLRRELEGVLEDADEQREAVVRKAEPQVVELALAAARKMTARALKDDDAFVALVRDALTRMLDKEWVRLRVSRDDLDRVRAIEPRILEAVDGLDRLEVIEDPRVENGVIAETRHGTVDATVEGQMRMILESIDRELQKEDQGTG